MRRGASKWRIGGEGAHKGRPYRGLTVNDKPQPLDSGEPGRMAAEPEAGQGYSPSTVSAARWSTTALTSPPDSL